MQTFLPFADFIQSAKVLDKKRCWKQVVEAKQIISILEKIEKFPINVDDFTSKQFGWINHPAVQMWKGHTLALMMYFDEFLWQCIHIHGINTKYDYLTTNIYRGFVPKPWWLGNEDFHRAMRSRLIEKDREFYLLLFPNDEGFNEGKYFWPVMETKTFRTI
jgi:hypothetical protein